MGLDEDWKASKVAYTELVYRPVVHSGYSTRDLGSQKAVRQTLTGATVNKLIFAAFTMAGALFPFVLYETRAETLLAMTPAVAVSLSILLVFGYVVLYCVQVLPSFVSSGSFAPLTTLPMPSTEVSRVAAMTLWRTIDYIVIASLICQVAVGAYFTGSFVGTLVIAFASVSSSLLAVGLALWLTRVFQTRLETSSLSGVRGLFRPLYFILWGLGVMSAVFLFNLIAYLSPHLIVVLATPTSVEGFVVSLILPFSAGLVSAYFEGEIVANLSLALGVAGLAIAGVASFLAYRVILEAITGVVLPSKEVSSVAGRGGLSFSVRGALSAYILKDLRVSSRNPATGFLFALPLFEIVAVVIPLTATKVVTMSVLLVGAQVGGGFALFIGFLLVTVEDLGVEKRTALPFSETVRTLSKVVVSTVAYLAVPCALSLVLLSKTLTYAYGAYIPVLTIASVFSACIVEVNVLRALAGSGYGQAVRFSVGIGSGEAVLLAPAIAYTVAYSLTHAHAPSFTSFAVATAAELALALLLLYLVSGAVRRRVNSALPPSAAP